MSLIFRKSSLHSHLTSPVRRKQDGLHTVTTGKNSKNSGTSRPAQFGELKYEQTAEAGPPVYKSIFSL